MKTLNATTFKATCLAVLDDVAETGAVYTITKRGRRVAQIGPPAASTSDFPQGALRGSFEILGDIVAPIFEPEAWEANWSVVAEPSVPSTQGPRRAAKRATKTKR